MVSFESKVNRGREGEKKCAAKLHCRPKRRMEKVGGSNKKKRERENRRTSWKSSTKTTTTTAAAAAAEEKRDGEKGRERGEARARMLRASPFCLNVVYAVARQQPLRSIHI